MTIRHAAHAVLVFGLAALAVAQQGDAMAIPLDSLALSVRPSHAREFLYTDKGGAHFYGEAASPWSRSYHGLYSHMHEFLDGWDLQLGGRPLVEIERAEVYPDRLVRHYAGLTETITLLDREPEVTGAALLVELLPAASGTLRLAPRADIRFVWETVRPEYEVRWDAERRTLLLASQRHLQRTPDEDWPVWLGLGCDAPWEFASLPAYETHTYAKDAARRAMATATAFRPGVFTIRCQAGHPVTMCIVLADEAAPASVRLASVLKRRAALVTARRTRLQDLVDRPGLESSDARLTRAAAWCRLGMDQLVMEQRGLGIYAGYPWFTTYWGRDSFISLSGACLATGDFSTARTILATFATRQDTNPQSSREGRLPNFVTVKEVQYATADGTWWWVRALRQYETASGDQAFADSLYPVVRLALDGALRHRTDAEGFVTHGEGETWMDAGGETRPFSPRGSRAVEVQALFAHALRYGVELARRQRQREDGVRWQEALDRLAGSFEARFFDPQAHTPYDHLNPDATPDHQVRPNGLLAWFVEPGLFTPERARATVEQVRDRLAYPWSVGSLAAQDPQFRPVHLSLERYEFDAAYHNGDVWLWLSGPLVSGLVAQHQVDAAWQQTSFLVDEILDRGVAGSLREIRDAIDTPGKDEYGGAVAQAWSLAELQRNLYEDYLGVRVDAPSKVVTIAPMLPGAIERLAAEVPVGQGGRLRVRCERRGDVLRTMLASLEGCTGFRADVVVTLDDGRRVGMSFQLQDRRSHEYAVALDAGTVVLGAGSTVLGTTMEPPPPPLPARGPAGFRFQPPGVLSGDTPPAPR